MYFGPNLIQNETIQSKKVLIKAVKEIVNIRQFKIDVTESIKDLFDFSDDNFDPDDILIPVENAVILATKKIRRGISIGEMFPLSICARYLAVPRSPMTLPMSKAKLKFPAQLITV